MVTFHAVLAQRPASDSAKMLSTARVLEQQHGLMQLLQCCTAPSAGSTQLLAASAGLMHVKFLCFGLDGFFSNSAQLIDYLLPKILST